jgi:hypothetical protein
VNLFCRQNQLMKAYTAGYGIRSGSE